MKRRKERKRQPEDTPLRHVLALLTIKLNPVWSWTNLKGQPKGACVSEEGAIFMFLGTCAWGSC